MSTLIAICTVNSRRDQRRIDTKRLAAQISAIHQRAELAPEGSIGGRPAVFIDTRGSELEHSDVDALAAAVIAQARRINIEVTPL